LVEFITEFLFAGSQIIIMFRLFYHTSTSLKGGRSVTPTVYWILTILSSALLGIYGIFADSIVIPLAAVVSIGFSLIHIWIESRRVKVKTVGDDIFKVIFPELTDKKKEETK